MNKLTYRQAYDKIIEAYFKDEIKPFDSKFCFCGTLQNNTAGWCGTFGASKRYSIDELIKMEDALLIPFCKYPGIHRGTGKSTGDWYGWVYKDDVDDYEETLFAGMSAALDVLKQIHIERGEIIDETPTFTKRTLCA